VFFRRKTSFGGDLRPCTRTSHVKVVGRSFRSSPTNNGGAVLHARKMFLLALRPSTDLNFPKITNQSHAGGMCPRKHIRHDGPCMNGSAKPGGCGSASRLLTHRGSGRGINPEGLCVAMVCPSAFRSWSGGLFKMRRGTTAATGVTNRLNQILTDRRSRCASLCAITPKFTPGTRL